MKEPTKISLFIGLLRTEIDLAEYQLDRAYENGDEKDIAYRKEIVDRYRALYDAFITCFQNPLYETGKIE